MEIMSKKPNGYWTYDNCALEALKYLTKIDFKRNSSSAYTVAHKNGWMKEISLHMISNGNKFKRCIYSYEFSDNSVYVGLTFNLNERHNNRNSHTTDTVTKYQTKTGLIPIKKQLTEYVDVEEARILEGEFVEDYKSNGWNILNIKQTGGIGGNTLFWTKEKCINIAKHCKSRTEFYNHRGAYSSSQKNGWLDEIYLILKSNRGGKFIYNIESCRNKSLLCRTKAEFKRKFLNEFTAAYRHGWLNDICMHMINGKLKENRLLWINGK
jgi:predicted GIY-YIG superfamily endonuclease